MRRGVDPDYALLRVVRSGRWFRAECRLCFLECDAVSGMGPRHAIERLPCGRALMDWAALHGGGNGRGCGEGHGGGAEAVQRAHCDTLADKGGTDVTDLLERLRDLMGDDDK